MTTLGGTHEPIIDNKEEKRDCCCGDRVFLLVKKGVLVWFVELHDENAKKWGFYVKYFLQKILDFSKGMMYNIQARLRKRAATEIPRKYLKKT